MNVAKLKVTPPLNQTTVEIGNGIHPQVTAGSAISFGWSNVDFSKFDDDWWEKDDFLSPEFIPGTHPIDLLLRFILSTGTGNELTPGFNGAFDVFEPGVGLGIPKDLVNIESFTNLQLSATEFDYDVNQRVFFIFTEPEPAKAFIERELCRPFGYYLATGNDGLIRCIRPRHPQKFYIGGSNNVVAFRSPASPSADIQRPEIDIGVYTAQELAEAISNRLPESVHKHFPGIDPTCWYTGNPDWKFRLKGSGFQIVVNATNSIWRTLGWTSDTTVAGTIVADEVRGKLPDAVAQRTLTKDDLWGVQVVDNRDDRIASVTFHFDYDVSTGNYLTFRRYTDAESMHLFGPTSASDYTIKSRGLISGGSHGKAWTNHTAKPDLGCSGFRRWIAPQWGVNADTWSALFARTLLDRYKQPPLKFRAKLKWKWNTLEIGDVVRVNYDIPGVLMDFERNKTTLDNRLFEVVELDPNPDGSIDATFLGHRWVDY